MRVKLTVAYDGTGYHGWQIQPNGITVEEVLNRELSALLKEEIRVTGASRTDAGVHALANVAVFDTNTRIPAEKISFALNQGLPDDIRIQDSCQVADDFHPYRCNSLKTYEYRILNRVFPMPVERLYSYFVHAPLNVMRIREAASYLVGEYDFISFSSSKANVEDTVRKIYSLEVLKSDDLVTLRITGDGFLYNMVRIIAGSLLQVGMGKRPPEWIREVLEQKNRDAAGPKAPALGLTLVSIEYKNTLENYIIGKNKDWEYRLIQKEIPYKGKAYVQIKACQDELFEDLLKRLTKKAWWNGAKEVYVSDVRENRIYDGMKAGTYIYQHAYDMELMERELESSEEVRISKRGLQSALREIMFKQVELEDAQEYCELFNRNFGMIEASETYTPEDIKKSSRNPFQELYFIEYKGLRAGIFEVYDWDSEIELQAVSIDEEYRGQGLAKKAVYKFLEESKKARKAKVKLIVCSLNENAKGLYQSLGFTKIKNKSSWYRAKDAYISQKH